MDPNTQDLTPDCHLLLDRIDWAEVGFIVLGRFTPQAISNPQSELQAKVEPGESSAEIVNI
ncbi:MAG TPA: hypothetical protein VGW57_15355 [Chthoniobacterales bacterium]|nr:hypothetical protein [Chthoniobacterales bacterium]